MSKWSTTVRSPNRLVSPRTSMTGWSTMLALDAHRLSRQNAVLLAHHRLGLEHQPVALVARIDDRRRELRIGREVADHRREPGNAPIAADAHHIAQREFLPVVLAHIKDDLQCLGAAERGHRGACISHLAR